MSSKTRPGEEVVEQFASALFKTSKKNTSLLVSLSDFPSLRLEPAQHRASGRDWANSIPPATKYDFVVADLPLGMSREDAVIGDQKLKLRSNWVKLANVLQFLGDDGICIALVEPSAFSIAEGPRFERILNSLGFYVDALINTPEGLLSFTSIRPVLAIITRTQSSSLFVAELDDHQQATRLAKAYVTKTLGNSLGEGILIECQDFHSFDTLKTQLQLQKLETQYKEYESHTLGDITIEINTVKSGETFSKKENAIYIPMLGTSVVTHNLEAATIKHHNLFQAVLDDSKATSEYVAAYFSSDLGQLALHSLYSGGIIQKIRKSDISSAIVALPKLAEQRNISQTHQRLSALLEAVTQLKSELALNPQNALAIKDQLEGMLEQVGGLTDADKVMSLVRTGESKTVEFKETFSLDVHNGTKEKRLELSALKTIVAFLNTNGGTLLIGVSDSGEISGIDAEISKFYKNSDKYLLHFKTRLKERIGEQYYPFIEQRIVNVSGKHVLMVECKESSSPCYLDRSDFYVRTNPATDKLEGPKLVEYVQNHFPH